MNSTRRSVPVRTKTCPALDFACESFDPDKALSVSNIKLFFPKAKTYNNLAEYYSHTVLKKKLERKEKVVPQERNYSWYIRTLGLWGRRAQLFEENLKSKRSRNRRVGKKPIKITYVPGSPLRSEKVIKLKSSFKSYWKRKCLLYKKGIEREENRTLFHKIKWLAKPLTALDLIQKATQNCTERTDTSKTKDAETVICQTDYLSQVDSAEVSYSEFKGVERSNSAVDCAGGEKRSCRETLDKSEKPFLVVENNNGLDSSNKRMIKADHLNSSQLQNKSSRITAKNLLQEQSNNVLTSKENILKTKQTESSISKNGIKPMEMKISPQLLKDKHLKTKCSKTPIKENSSRCTCFPNISCEISSRCKCGFYSTAMKNLQNFKIPKKKRIIK